ncbi:hypothetical protein LG293_17975 (plasmid) [Citricoccus nitrophenolicus]
MHAFRQFVHDQMQVHGMRAADIARAGGPTPQVVSRILTDDRPTLNAIPSPETIERLATAFGVEPGRILATIAEAMTLPTTGLTVDVREVDLEVLFSEVRRRAEGQAPTRTAPVVQAAGPHAYQRFILDQMKNNGWRQADITKHGGPSRQLISKILSDTRPLLDRRPDQATLEKLATAFGVEVEEVLEAVAKAMGLPASTVKVGLASMSDGELLAELRRRMQEGIDDEH